MKRPPSSPKQFSMEDLRHIYVVVPDEQGGGRVNLSIVQMSDRQFREWAKGKADLAGVRMIVPMGRIGLETRLYMINRLAQSGVKIYRLAADSPFA